MNQDEQTLTSLTGHKRKQPLETVEAAEDADDCGMKKPKGSTTNANKVNSSGKTDVHGGSRGGFESFPPSCRVADVRINNAGGGTWESVKTKISSSIKSADMTTACECLANLRDHLELLHSTEYPAMLSNLLPVFGLILKTIPCIPLHPIESRQMYHEEEFKDEEDEEGGDGEEEEEEEEEEEGATGEGIQEPRSTNIIRPEAQIRRTTLEICTRLPQNEVLRPHAGALLDIAMRVLRYDYEDNALLAARIIFELHKSYRPILVDNVKPFLDFVISSYKCLPSSSIQKNFAMSWKPPGTSTSTASSILPTWTTTTTTPSTTTTTTATATTTATPSVDTATTMSNQNTLNTHVKSTFSFRVLAEFPLTVMLLFQLYPKYIKTYLLQLLPLMMDALAQRPPIHVTAFLTPELAAKQRTATTSSSSSQQEMEQDEEKEQLEKIFKKRARELLSVQVKTLSFVTHLLRPYGDHLKQYEDRLATNVLNLFQMCPREALTIRKDLLLALRHIFATNFRKGFFRHVDTLLDERLLIGKHRQSEHAQIRVTAYCALADLLLHIKSRLCMAQIARVVHLYSRVLHDASMNLPLSVQTISVKLLLSMVDPAFQNKEEKASLGRDILFRILETLVLKLGTLVDHGIEDIKVAERHRMESSTIKESQGDNVISPKTSLGDDKDVEMTDVGIDESSTYPKKSWGDDKDVKMIDVGIKDSFAVEGGKVRDVKGNSTIQIKPLDDVDLSKFLYNSNSSSTSGTVQDIRDLIKPLIGGMKTLLWCIDKYGSQREKNMLNKDKNAKTKTYEGESSNLQQQLTWYEELAGQSMNSSERSLAQKYLVWALESLKVFQTNEGLPCHSTDNRSSEYREVLESYAISFSLLDSLSFQRIIGPHIDVMIEAMIDDDDVCVVANVFLMNGLAITPDFASCLLKCLMKDADKLDIGIAESDDDTRQRSAIVRMKLFCLVVSSLSIYPKSEQVLRPHIQQLISICIRKAMGSEIKYYPGNHLSLLQQLFRAIAGGKFEDSYKEILPLLPTLLNGLYRIFVSTDRYILRQVIIGLCLTIPARLSSLLPHLSLLLRIIVPALQSDDGDLINLGLRTLEFWVDNLNADFLFPILSKDEELFADLMSTLSTHLQPAPYQYGLLTLRLLGKLGGRNRTFLQSPMYIDTGRSHELRQTSLSVRCAWSPTSSSTYAAQNKVVLQIPLKRAEAVLAKVSEIPFSQLLPIVSSNDTFDFETLCTKVNKQQEFLSFRKELLYKTALEQANAAYNITWLLAPLLLQGNNKSDSNFWLDIFSEKQTSRYDATKARLSCFDGCDDAIIKCILRSWFYAADIPGINNGAFLLLERFVKQMVYKVSLFPSCVQQVDNDTSLNEQSDPNENRHPSLNSNRDAEKMSPIQNGKVEYLQAFGRFSFSGELSIGFNLFIFNESITEVLLSRRKRQRDIALRLIQSLVKLSHETDKFPKSEELMKLEGDVNMFEMKSIVNYAVENLLFELCQACFSCTWDLRKGLYDGISAILELMGVSWTRAYEMELFHVAIFCLKDQPEEAGLAQKNAVAFFFRLLTFLFRNDKLDSTILNLNNGVLHEKLIPDDLSDSPEAGLLPTSDCLPLLFVTEMISDNPLVRFAVFNGLEYMYGGKGSREVPTVGDVLLKHISTIKRQLFLKSLRNLQLQDQIAAIECFTFVLKHSPSSLPVLDNHVLVFISESLKMMSVADGEMTSESISHSTIVDKDGFNPRVSRNNHMLSYFSKISHATGICLREGFNIVLSNGFRMYVNPELPIAVQLRVSSLNLFHELLHQNSEEFLEAESSSSIGNILPHIVSLLFRSLTSRQETIVDAAYVALKEVLSLSVKGKNGEAQRLHRLPKNLLQMCIKPVLINLREYTKLSVPLLRGLSRLLSLLSTWFSQTLGEKLLDHLQKWTEPEKIINLGIWTRGEEAYVAAEIINLFQLLADDSSQFVEPLIKTTLKLESVLDRYNSHFTESPFRSSLARYLNKHGSAVALFFINEHRLKNPIYSELFQDMIQRQESPDLRKHLSSTECSNMVLNVCFETPLAIIRAEKGSSSSSRPLSGSASRTTVDTLSMHGIHIDLSGKKAALQKEIKIKQEKLHAAKRDAAKVEGSLRKRIDDANTSSTPQKQKLISNAKEKLSKMNAIISRLQNEIHAAEADLLHKFSPTSKIISNDGDEKQPRYMTLDSLELQEQGFTLIETLMKHDNSYISQHNDVVRAFRWLWRSKGRHFRLLHEDAISPRYSGESSYLAKFLVNYSKTAPNDVDVLFDLLRIFLQPTSADFSFVQDYLRHSVCTLLTLEYQKKVMLRFFPVIASEGIEELKVLSIQLLILPMLEHNFKSMNMTHSPHNTRIDSDENSGASIHTTSQSSTSSKYNILDEGLTAQLISGVLASRSKQDSYGSRLTIELLKLCSLLLDYVGENLGQHKQTVIKFAWNVLKSEDSKAKEWAYITISKFILRFDPPSKLTLRCYLSLLRAYQLETKDVVDVALDILVPTLELKLTKHEYAKAIKATVQILFEEGNSLPQLTHLWHIILRHKKSFTDFRGMFMSHLVLSLNKLGLPMNASVENRELSLFLVDLVLEWDRLKDDSSTQNGNSEVIIQNSLQATKMSASEIDAKFTSCNHFSVCRLNESEISAIVNFLVRLILLVAVADKTQQFLRDKAMSLFQIVITHWTGFNLHIEYFEKVIAMCSQGDGNFHKLGSQDEDDVNDGSNISALSPVKKAKSPMKSHDKTLVVSDLVLTSCLQIFSHLIIEDRGNVFLAINAIKISPIISTCFERIKTSSDDVLRKNLKTFLVYLFECKVLRPIQNLCKLLLEDLIFSTLTDVKDEKLPNCSPILFALSAVEGIVRVNTQFLNSFLLPLIDIAQIFPAKPPGSSTQKRHASKSSHASSFPVDGLFEAACEDMKLSYSMKSKNCQVAESGSTARPLGDGEDWAVRSLQLLFKSYVPYHFSPLRKKFITLLGDILDFSADIRVLLVISAQIGKWISADCHETPLTKSEMRFFLKKFTNFESSGLSEIDLQPLSYLVSIIVLRCKARHAYPYMSSKSKRSQERSSDLSPFSHVLNRLSMSSLMSTNTSIRNIFCNLMISSAREGLSEDNIAPRRDEILSVSLESVLTYLLQADLEGLGNRMWTFIYVDSLLAICNGPANTKGETPQYSLSSFLRKDRLSCFPIATCVGESTDSSIFLTSLRIMSSCDRQLSQELLESLFKSAWETFTNTIRLRIAKAMEKTLSRTYHAQFLTSTGKSRLQPRSSNAVKSFLQAIASLNPLPMISVDLLLTFTSNYNCWHEVRSLLEKQLLVLNGLPGKVAENYRLGLSSAIRRCYLDIGENDVWLTLKAKACTSSQLKYAVSIDMYGKVQEALQRFELLIEQSEDTHLDKLSIASNTELTLLEDRWVALHKETCQLAVLTKLSELSGFSKLLMECSWKNRDWEKLRLLCSSPAAISALELGDIDVKMNEIFLAIYDEKLHDIENLHAQTAQLCLYKWQLLPTLFSGCNTHLTLLRYFNQLVDIRESGQVMVEISQHTNGKSYPDLKNLLNAWRNRLPNDYEQLSVWDDVFQWRSYMFSTISKKFQWTEQSTLASLHDRPWTTIRMASAARQQDVMDVSLLSLSKLTDCAMDVNDAFAKLNEQILSYRYGSEDEKKGGLNLINTTNLSYFDSLQKSELFRLKAEFLESLGGKTKATQAYCHAVQLCPTYSRAWMSWGSLCWSLAELVEAQGRRQIASNSAEDKDKKTANAKKVCQYLAQSMGCYLEAIRCDASAESRMNLPRCLIMLAKDGLVPGLLCTTFEKYATTLPSWIWLPWIPQLLSSLCRIEATSAKLLLQNVLSSYPQAAYFSLRSFYLERRDSERSKQSAVTKTNTNTSVLCAEDLMSNLRKCQPTLWTILESILEELIIRFRPSYEEELLATISALLQRADSQIDHQRRANNTDDDAVRASFMKTLSRVSEKFFRVPSGQSTPLKDQKGKRSLVFTMQYKDSFERDFFIQDDDHTSKLSLEDIFSRLQKWKEMLENRVSSTPPVIPLTSVSPYLSAFSNNNPDLWAGSCTPPGSNSVESKKDSPENDKDSSPSSSANAATKAAMVASAAVAAANALEGGGGSQGYGWASVEIPGQYAPNHCSDAKPNPELHSKLIKFDVTVEVFHRHEHLVRRIGMIGTDGKVRQFLLQFAIPYWTKADERTTQLHLLLGKCLRKEPISSRRHLWIRSTPVIPIAQRLRMIAEDKNYTSLQDIFCLDCKMNGHDPSDTISVFNECLKLETVSEESYASQVNINKKIEAFNKVCESVSSRMLSNYVQNQYVTAELYFHFQRAFTLQTALNCLLQYAFMVNERTPSKFIMNKRNGHVLSPDFRFSYTNQGFIDDIKPVPFRLTRNIQDFIGPFLLDGVFTTAMASASTAISKSEKDIEQALQLICRDDIVSWYLSKSSQREGTQRTIQELEHQLADRVKKNVALIQSRFQYCSIKNLQDDETKKYDSCDYRVKELISLATSTKNLVSMPSNYAAWL
eukprot:CAMPEP_0176500498 /NCGR_PEP_ID=MMETSP0200_2-20121128/13588_1 /TAXON_ID=947934 /ORGANISM="Chaetoceros sp., Strain GSL56" /LENGTH=4498 /DNA_ID=CAMNT_0017899179 /DNA_START=1114 /DNA_END=14610 /DNA_ORIENTATION=+